MKRFNSTITQKKCKCGCDLYPTMGYRGYNIKHFPGEIKRSPKTAIVRKELNSATKTRLKSDYIKAADIVFSRFIKNRDSKGTNDITCICCRGVYQLDSQLPDGSYIVQAMHYMPRSIVSLRYDEKNVHAGCCFCNSHMFISPQGLAWQRYRQFIIDTYGEDELGRLESQKNTTSKMSQSFLLETITKYKTRK